MKKFLFIICLLISCHLFATPQQGWTRVACPNTNHEIIYERLMSFIEYIQGDVAYDDGHQIKVYLEVASDNCYEVIHTLDVVVSDNSFSYYLDQSVSFGDGNEMKLCFDEVRKQVAAIEELLNSSAFDKLRQRATGL